MAVQKMSSYVTSMKNTNRPTRCGGRGAPIIWAVSSDGRVIATRRQSERDYYA